MIHEGPELPATPKTTVSSGWTVNSYLVYHSLFTLALFPLPPQMAQLRLCPHCLFRSAVQEGAAASPSLLDIGASMLMLYHLATLALEPLALSCSDMVWLFAVASRRRFGSHAGRQYHGIYSRRKRQCLMAGHLQGPS